MSYIPCQNSIKCSLTIGPGLFVINATLGFVCLAFLYTKGLILKVAASVAGVYMGN